MEILTNEDLQKIKGGLWIYIKDLEEWIWLAEGGALPDDLPPDSAIFPEEELPTDWNS